MKRVDEIDDGQPLVEDIEYGPPLVEETSMSNLTKQSNFKFFGQNSPSRLSRKTHTRSGVFGGKDFDSPDPKNFLEEGDSAFIAEKIVMMTQEIEENPTFEVTIQNALDQN